jgi:hypothetical protein
MPNRPGDRTDPWRPLARWRESKETDRAPCPSGHPVVGANVDEDGRSCRSCRQARAIVRGLRGSGEPVLPGDQEMWAAEVLADLMRGPQ